MNTKEVWYWFSTPWACGGIGVDHNGVVRTGAPIFRTFVGQKIADLAKIRGYQFIRLKENS